MWKKRGLIIREPCVVLILVKKVVFTSRLQIVLFYSAKQLRNQHLYFERSITKKLTFVSALIFICGKNAVHGSI